MERHPMDPESRRPTPLPRAEPVAPATGPADQAAVSAGPAGTPAGPAAVLERAVNGFEYAAWHFGAAFARWRRDCLASLPGVGLSGTEASILHVVHLNGTAKGLGEISRLLHRDDLANLQYGLKKLAAAGYIEKAGEGASRKLTTYRTSDAGKAVVDAYLVRRRETLLRLTGSLPGTADAIERLTVMLHVMTGLYDQASSIVSGHHGSFGQMEP
jgi:predicted MarR family transcription regulator